jgi:hypothetical protein
MDPIKAKVHTLRRASDLPGLIQQMAVEARIIGSRQKPLLVRGLIG